MSRYGPGDLGSGTRDGTKFLRDDGTWQAVGGGGLPSGSMLTWAGASAPAGYLLCDGTSYATATYPDLFAVIGYTYGGSGANFNVPNCKGRVLVAQDTGQTEFDVLGETGGAKTQAAAGTNGAPAFTGSALGTHAHSAGTLVPSAHAGAAVADHAAHVHSGSAAHASHTHDYTQVPNHTHPHNMQGGTTGSTTGTNVMGSTATGGSARAMAIATSNPTGGVTTGTTAAPSASLTHGDTGNPTATLTHGVTQPSAHTMSGSSEAVSAGTPAGTVAAPVFTGSATSILQPYLVVKGWVIKT